MAHTNLIQILKPFTKQRLWVALTPDLKKVGASGRSPKSALDKAYKAGIKEPIIMRAIPDYSGFISINK